MRRLLLLALVACRTHASELPWQEEELHASHARPHETLAEAQAELAAATGPAAIVRAAVEVAALGGTPPADTTRAAIDAAAEPDLADIIKDADPTRAPTGAIALRLALLAHHRGDDAAARDWLARYAAAPEPDLDARAKDLAAESTPPDARVVAVLLPLSGRYAPIGAELRAAIELAPKQGATVVYEDTLGDETGAAAAVDRAAAKGAVAILGPVGERESVAAARRAAELGIPIGLLAPADGASPDAGVFRLATSDADEARGAARVAAADNFLTAAVLAPRDDVGQAMADAFAAEAAADGITVTRVGFYDPTASDLEPDVKAFLGIAPNANAHKHVLTPAVDFSLLYIPDRYDRAALVIAYLPYLGVALEQGEDSDDPDLLARKYKGHVPQVVQLLGSGGWNHPGLLTRGGDDVEGAMFVDTCAGALDDGGASGEIAARFHDATGEDATSPALEAYDAATIVFTARAAAATETNPREAARQRLAHAQLGDDAACPAAAVGAGGELERDPVVVQVDGGQMVLQESY